MVVVEVAAVGWWWDGDDRMWCVTCGAGIGVCVCACNVTSVSVCNRQ